MAKILSFFQNEQKLERFIIFEAKISEEIFRLAPQVMPLTSRLFLINLNSSWSYWEKVAAREEHQMPQLIEQTLQQTFGKEKLYVFASHPFQAYLLYRHLELKHSHGFFHGDSKIVENLYSALTWKHWCLCATELHYIFEEHKLLQKERQQASGQIKRLEKLFTSLGVKTLKEMESLDFDDLQRRFSSYIGLLWKWTFPKKFETDEPPLFQYALDISMLGFPWFNLKLTDPPLIQRHLEYPLTQWDHLKPQLEEDFIKLSRLPELASPYRVMEFCWQLILFDLEECCLPIYFKYPLCLEKEKEQDFSSLMTQFQFAFEEINQQLKQRYRETDHVNCAFIIGWKLSVTQKIYPTEQTNNLFDESQAKEIQFQTFQNKIKNPLQRFEVLDISIPSLNFQPYEQSESSEASVLQLQPFYLLVTPQPIEAEKIVFKRFIERTSAPWWDAQTPQNSYRDYYMCEVDKRIIYAFRDYLGNWYQHGIFS